MIQLDCVFPLGSEWYSVLTVVGRDSGYGASTAVAVKGADRYAVAFVLNTHPGTRRAQHHRAYRFGVSRH